MYKITNYMTIPAIKEGLKNGKSIYLKPIKKFIIDIDLNTGEETKTPTPDPMPNHDYEVVGPFNKQVPQFSCHVRTGERGQVVSVY